MRSTADVVVVGGGVVGCSAAYHLASAGAGAVVLLERADALGTGSTGACAGGFRFQFGSRANIELSLVSVPMITGFTEEHGLALDVWRDGYVFLVRGERDWRDFLTAVELQRSLGIDVRVLTPEEAAEMAPGISLEDVIGGTFCAEDGIADPSGLTQGYATLARRVGAELELGVGVQELVVEGDRVIGVRTSRGVIAAPVVVNAAGPWAGELARTAGLDLPLEPIPRMVVTTGPFPEAPVRRTLVIDSQTSFYFHKEGEGVLMGMGGIEEKPSFDLIPDERFIADELLPAAVRIFPPLERASIRSTWAGLYEMTPDRHPIIGESPVRGFFLANGFSGHGFQHAPVVGKLLAELILDGRATSVDISTLGFDRFARGDLVAESHVV